MGIKDLYQILNSECPSCMAHNVHFKELFGTIIAVDVSIFLCKLVKSAGPERWIDSFTILICMLKKYGTKPLFIFDGPNPPKEKKEEQEHRRAEMAKIKAKVEQGKKLLKVIEDQYLPTKKRVTDNIITDVKAIVGKSANKINFYSTYDVYQGLKESVARKELQSQPILPEYSVMAKELISSMGLSFFQAEGEAETLCAVLCLEGFADAVLSEDTDVLAYGTPFLLSKIDFAKQTVTVVSHDAILELLGFDHSTFLDLCILLRCDYNKRVKGFPPDGKKHKKPVGIGAKGAMCMIREYRCFETMEPHITNIELAKYERCRYLFTPELHTLDLEVPYSLPIDLDRLKKFLVKHSVQVSVTYITDTWTPTTKLIFSKDSEEEEVLTDDDLSEEEKIEPTKKVPVSAKVKKSKSKVSKHGIPTARLV